MLEALHLEQASIRAHPSGRSWRTYLWVAQSAPAMASRLIGTRPAMKIEFREAEDLTSLRRTCHGPKLWSWAVATSARWLLKTKR